jgi:uncharacterized membrane protein
MIDFVHLFSSFPSWFATFLIAMTPIGELRAAIPVALAVYKLSWFKAYFWSVFGNMIPVIFILWLFEPISKFLIRRFRIFEKFFGWLFTRTRRKHTKSFEKWGALALIIFVAIPLPMTGGWSGALAAFVFGIPMKRALLLIFLGILIAGVIVILTSLGISFSFNNFIR